MWEISNSLQLLNFLRSCGLGAVLCLLYDCLKAFRKTHYYSILTVFFQDIAYLVLTALIFFVFLLSVTNGEPRGYIFVAAISGFLLCRYTVSRILLKLLIFIISRFGRFFRILNHGFYDFFEKCEKKLINLRKKLKKNKKSLENTQ